MFKKYANKIMKFFKGQEVLLDKKSPVGEGVEVIKGISGQDVLFHSGRKMSLSDLEQYGKDPLDTSGGVFESIDESKMTTTQANKPIKPKKPIPYSDQPYGGLKKVGSSRTESSQYDRSDEDEAIDDGKPHKSKSKAAGKPLNLSEEIEQQERKRKEWEKRVKEKGRSFSPDLTQGLDSVDDRNLKPTPSTVASQPSKPQTTLEKLLKKNDDKDNYVDVDFNLKVTVKLPPRKVLQSLEEYFDVEIIKELAEMINWEVRGNLTSEDFLKYIEEEVEKHVYPRKKKPNK